MRRGYQISKWQRRAETAHRKLVELAEDILSAEGESELYALAASAHCEAHQLVGAIEGERK